MVEKYGRYEITKKLGEGGMGTVYRAYDPRFKRDVALKVLSAELLQDEASRGRFNQEAEIIAALEHSAIVPVYDFGEDHNQPFFVMRLMRASLAQRLRGKPMQPDEAETILTRLAGALDKAHNEGFVHRDVKPHNVMLDEDGKAYLADFGIARLVHSSTTFSGGKPQGTPDYISPEQAQGLAVDKRTDVYALGAMLYHMLVGRPPYTAPLEVEVIARHIHATIPNILEACPDLPGGCDVVLAKALAKDPERRFPTAGALAYAFHLAVANDHMRLEAYLRQVEHEGTLPTGKLFPVDDLPVAEASFTVRFTRSVRQTSKELQRRMRVIPRWAQWTMAFIFALGALAGGYWMLDKASATGGNERVMTMSPVVPKPSPTVTATLTPAPTPAASDIILVRNSGPGAAWQSGNSLLVIPENGRIPITATHPITLHANAGLMDFTLPDRSQYYLNSNTSVVIQQIIGLNGAQETAVQLLQGQLAVETMRRTSIFSPRGHQASLDAGFMGVEVVAEPYTFSVDCLRETCYLLPPGQGAAPIVAGERYDLSLTGVTANAAGARFSQYMAIVDPGIPTLTFTPTAAPSPTLTGTPTLTPTPAITVIPGQRMVIGYSVQNRPIEAVRFGSGDGRVFIFIGGLQAGYAPNSVDLAEEFVIYFGENPTAVPTDATVYIIPNMSPDSPALPGQLEGRYNANGVELNRNWGCRWAEDPVVMSRVRPGAGGTFPFSEPETRAVATFIHDMEPTAVIFWTSHADRALASPGACVGQSQVSLTLSQVYGRAADYDIFEGPVVLPNVDLTGDAVNFLDYQGIPAVAVLMSHFLDVDWERNLVGVTTILANFRGARRSNTLPFVNTTAVPTPSADCLPVAERWDFLYAQYENALGCPVGSLAAPAAAVQRYAHGWMIWRGDNDYVYVLYDDYTLASFLMDEYDPYEWTDLRKGAFGYIWLNNATVRAHLGEPEAQEEVARDFVVQDFANGVIFFFSNNGTNYILFTATTTWDSFPE